MIRSIVLITARDKPGVLKKIYDTVADNGGNVVFNFSYVEGDVSHIILIVDMPEENLQYVAEVLSALFTEEGASVEVAPLGPQYFDKLVVYLAEAPNAAVGLLKYLHPEERALLISKLDEDIRSKIYVNLPISILAETLPYAPAEILKEIAASVKPRDLAYALELLDPDDMADVLQTLGHEVQKAVLKYLPEERKKAVESLLAYRPDTAGGLMTTKILTVPPDARVGKVIEELTSGKFEIGDEAYVVDIGGRLMGVAPLSRLIKEDPAKPVGRVMRREYVTVDAAADQREVATVLMKYDLTKVPVVDRGGRLLGVVTVDDVLDVVRHETLEETLAGFGKIRIGYIDNYVLASIKSLYIARTPWILSLALLSFFTATVIAAYESAIEKYVILAAFIPLIIDSGGNIGTQAAALVLRSFALGHLVLRDFYKVVRKELATGFLVGLSAFPLVFAMAVVLSLGIGYTMWEAAAAGLAIGLSIVATLTASAIIGASIVFAAYKAKIDPATMSAATITTIVDLAGTFLYLATSTTILTIIYT